MLLWRTNEGVVFHALSCRDLKSGNLLVDQDNMVRVADFGLSRLYHGMHTMTGGLGTFQVRQGHVQPRGALRLPREAGPAAARLPGTWPKPAGGTCSDSCRKLGSRELNS